MITRLLGVRIKELRAATGLSQESFAYKINMARTYFAEVETGKRNISMRNLVKIANGLNVTLEEFFDSNLFDPLYIKTDDDASNESPPPSRHEQPQKQPTASTRVNYAAISLPAKGESRNLSQRPIANSSPRSLE